MSQRNKDIGDMVVLTADEILLYGLKLAGFTDRRVNTSSGIEFLGRLRNFVPRYPAP